MLGARIEAGERWGCWRAAARRGVSRRHVGDGVARASRARRRGSCYRGTSSCSRAGPSTRSAATRRPSRGPGRRTRAGTSRRAARSSGSAPARPHAHPVRPLRTRPGGLDAGLRAAARPRAHPRPARRRRARRHAAAARRASSRSASSRPRSCSKAWSTSCSSSCCARGFRPRPERPEPSWLGALRDPVVGEAVSLLHAEPEREWTNAALAHELAVSSATLSRRFAAVLGETPAPTSHAGGWTSRPAACATATSRWTRSPARSATRRSTPSPARSAAPARSRRAATASRRAPPRRRRSSAGRCRRAVSCRRPAPRAGCRWLRIRRPPLRGGSRRRPSDAAFRRVSGSQPRYGYTGTMDEDERWIVIDGRRWRRSDPSLPEARRKELVGELMSARSAVGWAKRRGDADAERGCARPRPRGQGTPSVSAAPSGGNDASDSFKTRARH